MKLIEKFKKSGPKPLIIHLIISLAYPLAKAIPAEYNNLLIFTDTLTIIGFVYVIMGIFYSMVLKGDFDITRHVLNRSLHKTNKDVDAFREDLAEERKYSINYPLLLGLFYLVLCAVLALTVLK